MIPVKQYVKFKDGYFGHTLKALWYGLVIGFCFWAYQGMINTWFTEKFLFLNGIDFLLHSVFIMLPFIAVSGTLGLCSSCEVVKVTP